MPNATEAELDKLAKDPQAAANFQNEQILGRVGAHSKIKNTVNDIQEKYEAIKKLEQVSIVEYWSRVVCGRTLWSVLRASCANIGAGRDAR